MKIIDAHSHLWLRQDTSWDGKPIRSLKNGRSIFLGEEAQMMPPFIIDSQNSAEVFLSNMDYAQVGAAVVVQEFIDGLQNDYLETVQKQYPDRFFCCGMADYRQPGFLAQAQELIEQRGFRGIAIPGHRLRNQGDRSMIARTERIKRPVPLISQPVTRDGDATETTLFDEFLCLG